MACKFLSPLTSRVRDWTLKDLGDIELPENHESVEPDFPLFRVEIPPAVLDDEINEINEFLGRDDAHGLVLQARARTFVFTHADTAFAFKMRFG